MLVRVVSISACLLLCALTWQQYHASSVEADLDQSASSTSSLRSSLAWLSRKATRKLDPAGQDQQQDGQNKKKPNLPLGPQFHLRNFVSQRFYEPRVPNAHSKPQSEHLSEPPSRSQQPRRHPSGLCVAIPTVPRPTVEPNVSSWQLLTRLLRDLDGERASGEGVLEHAIKVVVYSASCMYRFQPGAADVGNIVGDGTRVTELNRAVEEQYTQAVRVSRELSVPVYVVPANVDVCAFIYNKTRLEEEVPRELQYEDWSRWMWMAKESIDFVYAVRQCMVTNPRYILFLEDDTKPIHRYDLAIERFISEDLANKSWAVLSLYHPRSFHWPVQHADEYLMPCCTQALLFNVTALPALLNFVEGNFMRAPIDLLLRDYLKENALHAYVHVPSLFQHMGVFSTKDSSSRAFHFDFLFGKNASALAAMRGAADGVRLAPLTVT
ncbi:hypothetical protein CLOM_g20939 [Closterium sp. NIES-68]|nr:hypothetical protein CLOM_g20939 [Closterium sp. NIES-68]GJP80992.1 hypothetical protein CLOP_g11178 [Closterium sp. NIES-67]